MSGGKRKIKWTRKRRPVEERFWQKVDRRGPNDCWLWTGAKTSHGYGNFGVADGQTCNAHRFSFLLHGGEIPLGKYICHRCDVRACVNPGHLFLGTPRDNTQDMISKGRSEMLRGPAAEKRKLTDDDVRAIRLATGSRRELGRQYGVNPATITRVIHRKILAHVQ